MKLLIASLIGVTSVSAAVAPDRLSTLSSRFAQYLSLQALPSSAPTYVMAPVSQRLLAKSITATGALNTTRNVDVGSQLSGLVTHVNVDFNDIVKKGQVLAELDARSYQAAVDQSDAELRSAQAAVQLAKLNLDRAQITARDAELQKPVLDARVEKAAADLDAATAAATRKSLLSRRGAGSVMDALNAADQKKAAMAAYAEAVAIRRAQDNIAIGAMKDVERARSEWRAAQLGVAKAQAQLNQAEADLDRTKIRSPIDGVVVGRSVDAGETLATSLQTKTLFVVAGDLHKMDIYARVDESDIGLIRVGQPAMFTVDAFPGRPFKAIVKQIRKDPVVVQNVVSYTVLLSTANDDLSLLPGMTALAEIMVTEPHPVLEVPTAALQFTPKLASAETAAEDPRPKIWIRDGGGAPKPIFVRLGQITGAMVAVSGDGLRAGSSVIVREVDSPRLAASLWPPHLF